MADVLALRCPGCALAVRFKPIVTFSEVGVARAMRDQHRHDSRDKQCPGNELRLELGAEPMPDGEGAMLRTPWIPAKLMSDILDAAKVHGVDTGTLKKLHQVARRSVNAAQKVGA